jgi:hypothetical protein
VVKCQILGLCDEPDFSPWVLHFGIAGFAEEALKFGVFLWFIRRHREVDEPLDGIVYLGVMALAFAFDENIGYFLRFTQDGALIATLTGDRSFYDDAVTMITVKRAIPGHLLIDTVAGWLLAVGLHREQLDRWVAPLFLCAVLLHGTWNLLAGTALFFPYVVLLVVLSVVAVLWAWQHSPHRVRQVHFRTLLGRVQWSDPAIPRQLTLALRSVSGGRQREVIASVEAALDQRPGDAAPIIGKIMAGERDGGNQRRRVVGLLGGIVLISFALELLHLMIIYSLS